MTDGTDDSETQQPRGQEATGHLLCLGYGYAARHAAALMKSRGWAISGTTRSEKKADAMREDGIRPVLWEAPAPLPAEALADDDHGDVTDLLVSVSPGEHHCPALAAIKARLEQAPDAVAGLRSIVYYSSTGVYGDHEGRWVNEAGPLMPDTWRGRRRWQTEHRWEDFAENHAIALTSLRLAGIYGPGRNALESLIARAHGESKGLAQRIYKPGQVFSRIHVDDIAEATAALFARADDWPDEHVLNLADDLPSPPQDVLEYAAYLLGIDPPPLIPLEDAELSPMARSFYADNKRVSAQLAKDTLHWSPRYPTYREGLTALHRQLEADGRTDLTAAADPAAATAETGRAAGNVVELFPAAKGT